MTRKHYEALARAFALSRPPKGLASKKWEQWRECVESMCDELRMGNPRFDEDKFKAWCDTKFEESE